MQPLANRRVLVTRPRGQGSRLAELLEAAGAIPILIPTIEIVPPASYCALDAAVVTLRTYDWLLFTSANAVHAFVERARQLAISPCPQRIGVVGKATADAVVASGLASAVDLIPPRAVAESLAEALAPHAAGASVLLVRAAVARDLLPDALSVAGAHVTVAEAYRNVIPHGSVVQLAALFAGGGPDAVTFTSASTAQNLAALMSEAMLTLRPEALLASIGPVTSQAMRDLGLEPTIEAPEATMKALVEAITDAFSAVTRTLPL